MHLVDLPFECASYNEVFFSEKISAVFLLKKVFFCQLKIFTRNVSRALENFCPSFSMEKAPVTKAVNFFLPSFVCNSRNEMRNGKSKLIHFVYNTQRHSSTTSHGSVQILSRFHVRWTAFKYPPKPLSLERKHRRI